VVLLSGDVHGCGTNLRGKEVGYLRVHRYRFSVLRYRQKCRIRTAPFLKILKCASGFENFAKIFWIQDI
jgi:hypothetical protein